MDKDYYRKLIMDQLTDATYYQELPKNIDRKTTLKIDNLIKDCESKLTDNESKYLTQFEVKSSLIYGLPKIHKSKEIQNAIQDQKSTYIELLKPGDLKLRPIIAGPQCATHRLSNLLDILLKPLCQKVPSFIRDDMDFLNYIPTEVDETTKLVSFDVTSLYTNIPIELGVEAISFWIKKYPELIDSRFEETFIIDGLKIVLENNSFLFDNSSFLQVKGVAMGTKVAPTYATLVMGYLEDKLYQNIRIEFGDEFSDYIQQNWKRYLDDCFIFWNRSAEDLDKFYKILNFIHSSINFTMEMSQTDLAFLDILIKKNVAEM